MKRLKIVIAWTPVVGAIVVGISQIAHAFRNRGKICELPLAWYCLHWLVTMIGMSLAFVSMLLIYCRLP